MTAVNCPMCELRFTSRNERDWHLRNEHQHAHVRPPADGPAVRWHRPEPGPRDGGRGDPDEEAPGTQQPRP